MTSVGGVTESSSSYDADTSGSDDDELRRLRDDESRLNAAYMKNPGDLASMGALVRVQQSIRKREEDASRLALNAAPSQSADVQTRGYGIRLPVATGAIRTDTPVAHLSTHEEVQGEIDAITSALSFASLAGPAFLANVDPKLVMRLSELQTRLRQIDAADRAPVAAPHVALTQVHALPEAHEGNAPQIAEMHVELTSVLHANTFSSALEVMTYANQYIAYTAKHPEMRELHDHAVANFGRLVDEATDRDAERARGEQIVQDQVARVQLHAPPGMEQMVAVGALGLLTAQTVHLIAGLVPIAGEVQAGLEALSGHGMWGLGEDRIEGVDRLLTAVNILCGLAPYARKILNGIETEAAVARVARESGKSDEEARNFLKGAVKIDNEKVQVKAALEKAKAGKAISAAEREAIDRVSVTLSGREGVLSGDLARTARGEAPKTLIENPTGSWGGPGAWVAKPESMSPSAAAFQESVTGVRAMGHTYMVGGVEFDGVRVGAEGKVTLLEAKDRYSQFLLSNGEPKWFMKWKADMVDGLVEKARVASAHGATFEVHCSEAAVADRLRRDFAKYKGSIVIIHDGAQ